jgi:hypothetical protein
MKNKHRLIVANSVLIGRDYWELPIRVDLRAFLRYSRRLDVQLRRLTVRWAHAASPCSRGVPATEEPAEASVPPT